MHFNINQHPSEPRRISQPYNEKPTPISVIIEYV